MKKYTTDLRKRVWNIAYHYIQHGCDRSTAFTEAWHEVERPQYEVLYYNKYGVVVTKHFPTMAKAGAYQQSIESTLTEEEAGTLEIRWNKEADRLLHMEMEERRALA